MSALISVDDAIKKYGDAQGNILKGHGRQHTALLLVELTDQANAREWIRQLLAGLSTGPSALDTVRVTSTEKQLRDREAFKAAGQPADAGLFTSLLFTAEGLRYLGVPTPPESQDQTPGLGRADAFAGGMRAAAARNLLGDPDPVNWDAGWWQAPGQASPLHALLLLADDQLATRLQPAIKFMTERSVSLGVRVRITQHGERLVEAGHDIEHFGYADGVSQPLYLDNDQGAALPHPRDTALGAEDLVLVPDVLGSEDNSYGSFLVYRKLQQQVRAFKDAEGEAEDAAPGTLANVLGLAGDDRARAGAMLVGRFENGTPLALSGTETDPHTGKPVFTNNFDFQHDTQGLKCPFHAHIRKVNPRGETPANNELRHRITRRGVPYGPKLADGAPEDGVSRGLLFMCYQRNIGQQFEFMQRAWANNANFIHGANPATGVTAVGLDPIIGQGPRGPLTFPVVYAQAGTKPADFKEFVRLKGGEYFYAPSLSGLRRLAAAPAA